MPVLLDLSMCFMMVSFGVYMAVLSVVAVAGLRAKKAMMAPQEEKYPPFLSGEDLL